jgi:hypothetical protein|uniref:Uncharacterized protein n=1 Tax=viral metagenome TaxID=1070528 RepID=A0A6C0D4W4_9ZZZZ
MSSQSKEKLNASMIISKQGIFGFGLSHNNNLDFMIIVVLAGMGIIIKLFFPEKFSRLGNTGPATSTIWGYGLTAIALSIMLFMGIYVSKNIFEKNGNFVEMLFSNVSPIFFTLLILIYAIFLNFQYFKRINSNRVTNEYHTYSFMSSVLTIIQIGLVSTYLFYYLSNTDTDGGNNLNNMKIELSKNAVYILSIINFLFLMMINISLQFFSTDETPIIK